MKLLKYLKQFLMLLFPSLNKSMQNIPPINQPVEEIKPPIIENNPTEKSKLIYSIALDSLNKSLVTAGVDPEFGCAISVWNILDKAGIDIPQTASTLSLQKEIISSGLFTEVFNPIEGDIIIAATGTSTKPNTSITHGHTGIVGHTGAIFSNESSSGLWKTDYDLESWNNRYDILGGYTSRFFRAK